MLPYGSNLLDDNLDMIEEHPMTNHEREGRGFLASQRVKLGVAISGALLLGGCSMMPSSEGGGSKSNPQYEDPAFQKLANTTEEIHKELSRLAAIEQADAPEPEVYNSPEKGPLAKRPTFSWRARVDKILHGIADAIGYEFRVYGSEPAHVPTVSVDAHRDKAFDVLQDIGYQAGRNAGVVVDENKEVVQLVYTNDHELIPKMVGSRQ